MWKLELDAEEINAATSWHGGQSSMLYAVSSTGSLSLGTHRRVKASGDPMTDAEWFADLCWELSAEAEESADEAAKQLAEECDTSEREELEEQENALRSMTHKAEEAAKRASTCPHCLKDFKQAEYAHTPKDGAWCAHCDSFVRFSQLGQ
jgi:hypothetical protein